MNDISGFYATVSGATITISRLSGAQFTVTVNVGQTSHATTVAASVEVETLTLPANTTQVAIYDASAPGTDLATGTGGTASAIASAITTSGSPGFTAVVNPDDSTQLIVTRSTASEFQFRLDSTLDSFGNAQQAAVFNLAGAVRVGDTWNLALDPAGPHGRRFRLVHGRLRRHRSHRGRRGLRDPACRRRSVHDHPERPPADRHPGHRRRVHGDAQHRRRLVERHRVPGDRDPADRGDADDPHALPGHRHVDGDPER